jgi:hypothetical protein
MLIRETAHCQEQISLNAKMTLYSGHSTLKETAQAVTSAAGIRYFTFSIKTSENNDVKGTVIGEKMT